MHDAFGTEAETVLPDRHMAGIPAIEIFGGHLGDARIDPRAQRFSHVDVLTRDAKRHLRPPLSAPHDKYDIGSGPWRRQMLGPPSQNQDDAPADNCFSRRLCTE